MGIRELFIDKAGGVSHQNNQAEAGIFRDTLIGCVYSRVFGSLPSERLYLHSAHWAHELLPL